MRFTHSASRIHGGDRLRRDGPLNRAQDNAQQRTDFSHEISQPAGVAVAASVLGRASETNSLRKTAAEMGVSLETVPAIRKGR